MIIFRNADTLVFHFESKLKRICFLGQNFAGYLDILIADRVVDCVRNQIDYNLLHPECVHHYERVLILKTLKLEFDVLHSGLRLENAHCQLECALERDHRQMRCDLIRCLKDVFI